VRTVRSGGGGGCVCWRWKHGRPLYVRVPDVHNDADALCSFIKSLWLFPCCRFCRNAMVQCRTVSPTRDCIAAWRATPWGPWCPELLAFLSLVSVLCDGTTELVCVCVCVCELQFALCQYPIILIWNNSNKVESVKHNSCIVLRCEQGWLHVSA
jgi:hypothetical protein